MEVKFDKEYLSDLYHKGKTKDKSHRYQPSVIKRYVRCVDYLYAVLKPEELYQYKSLNFEKLKGDKKDIWSIRVNDQYRVAFTLTHGDEALLTICNIIELSNHYR